MRQFGQEPEAARLRQRRRVGQAFRRRRHCGPVPHRAVRSLAARVANRGPGDHSSRRKAERANRASIPKLSSANWARARVPRPLASPISGPTARPGRLGRRLEAIDRSGIGPARQEHRRHVERHRAGFVVEPGRPLSPNWRSAGAERRARPDDRLAGRWLRRNAVESAGMADREQIVGRARCVSGQASVAIRAKQAPAVLRGPGARQAGQERSGRRACRKGRRACRRKTALEGVSRGQGFGAASANSIGRSANIAARSKSSRRIDRQHSRPDLSADVAARLRARKRGGRRLGAAGQSRAWRRAAGPAVHAASAILHSRIRHDRDSDSDRSSCRRPRKSPRVTISIARASISRRKIGKRARGELELAINFDPDRCRRADRHVPLARDRCKVARGHARANSTSWSSSFEQRNRREPVRSVALQPMGVAGLEHRGRFSKGDSLLAPLARAQHATANRARPASSTRWAAATTPPATTRTR